VEKVAALRVGFDRQFVAQDVWRSVATQTSLDLRDGGVNRLGAILDAVVQAD
jgi:hypothetical protein